MNNGGFKRSRGEQWVQEKQGSLKKNKKCNELAIVNNVDTVIARSLEIFKQGNDDSVRGCFEFWALCVEKDPKLYNKILCDEKVIDSVFEHAPNHKTLFFAFFRYIFDVWSMLVVKKFTPCNFLVLKKLMIDVFNNRTDAMDDVVVSLFIGYKGDSLELSDDDGVLKAVVELINAKGCSNYTRSLLVLLCCESYIMRKYMSERQEFMQKCKMMKMIFECINTHTRPDITMGIIETVLVAVKTPENRDKLEDAGGIKVLEQLHHDSCGKLRLDNIHLICGEILDVMNDAGEMEVD